MASDSASPKRVERRFIRPILGARAGRGRRALRGRLDRRLRARSDPRLDRRRDGGRHAGRAAPARRQGAARKPRTRRNRASVPTSSAPSSRRASRDAERVKGAGVAPESSDGRYFARPALASRRANAAAAGERLRPLRRTIASVRPIAGCSSFTPTTDAGARGSVSRGTTANARPLSTSPISVDTWRTSMIGRGSGGSSASAWSISSRLREACETRASG